MFEALQETLGLGSGELLFAAIAVFIAGVVRGFSGFALSALIMGSLVAILPPLALIPVCYVCEGTASVLMARGGIRDADRKVAWGLAIGSFIGVPLGLLATMSLSPEWSKIAALCVILILAIMQLFKTTPAFLATRSGLYMAGILAGVVTGLASVGGMVVALYVLASNMPAARMRATLVMFLFLGMFGSGISLIATGVLNSLSLLRGLALSPVVLLGVALGTALFRPSLEKAYKTFCLLLLMGLALVGLLRFALERWQ